ncbi:MAG: indolepyruvate oxidoreductase subunit beta [Endomicrobium sp.]|jgi:indolepyruvate ferredoxin oxidoreductase beta subunit|nr:indolepyruvate oxidoreductase subunit beta [Endomicrobium sp.]
MENKTINILFCGTGGQGVLTAAEIVCLAAVYDGYHTKKSEVHGMAQRGGSVESHVRIGDKVASPIIEEGRADFLVSFHKGEHSRMAYYLSKDGKDLFSDFETADKILSNKKFINTYMLGALSKHLNIKQASWLKALEIGFKGKFIDENQKVFLQAAK